MKALPRLRAKGQFPRLFFTGLFMMAIMAFIAAFSMRNTNSTGLIGWIILLALWYPCMILTVAFFSTAFHTVRIEDEAITVCLGPVTLRRIPLDSIRTVGLGRIGSFTGKLLVLSAQDPSALDEKGNKALSRSETYAEMEKMGITKNVSHYPARAALLTGSLWQKLWLEHTPEAEAALRRSLPGATFLL